MYTRKRYLVGWCTLARALCAVCARAAPRAIAQSAGARAHSPQSGHSGGAGGVDLVALSLVVKWLVHQFNRQGISPHTHTHSTARLDSWPSAPTLHFARHTRQTLSKPAPKSCARRAIGVGRKLVSSARRRARGASHLCAHQAGTNHARVEQSTTPSTARSRLVGFDPRPPERRAAAPEIAGVTDSWGRLTCSRSACGWLERRWAIRSGRGACTRAERAELDVSSTGTA